MHHKIYTTVLISIKIQIFSVKFAISQIFCFFKQCIVLKYKIYILLRHPHILIFLPISKIYILLFKKYFKNAVPPFNSVISASTLICKSLYWCHKLGEILLCMTFQYNYPNISHKCHSEMRENRFDS